MYSSSAKLHEITVDGDTISVLHVKTTVIIQNYLSDRNRNSNNKNQAEKEAQSQILASYRNNTAETGLGEAEEA